MSFNDFINKNPSRDEVLEVMCTIANNNCLHIEETWCFKELSEKFNFSINDFYDDQDELTEYERKYIGLYNWKVK
jgi:hypothetical protein